MNLTSPHVVYFVKQFPEVTLHVLIKIYLCQKNDILPGIILQIEAHYHPFEIHHVITIYFTV